tara:strand:+ start:481 stop:714 length:234 start_codon:yes stop_codon:yes gene_type:complete
MDDPVNPKHYKQGDVECIDAIRASMTAEAFKGYLKGTNMKYMWRYEDKQASNPLEDLKKAQWFLDELKKFVSRERNL